MSKISTNLKFLRKKFGYTQESFAQKIQVNRPAVGAYEEGRAEPKLITLNTIADTFGLSIDALVNTDLSKVSEKEFDDIKVDVTGSKMRILTISLDKDDNEGVELVPQKASAGYTNGYGDPEYLEELPKLYLPMLSGGTHRAFELQGDSMLPLTPGTIVVGGYIDNWNHIKTGETYVIVSDSEGVVYKRVINKISKEGVLTLCSDNTVYDNYDIVVSDVKEVWEAKMYISKDFPEVQEKVSVNDLAKTVLELQTEVLKLKSKE